jgi:hypothetical protein
MGITDRANIKRDRHTIAGISLIEVLAVIVLLVVGIFSVIQLFPPGFLVNRQSEEATIAGRLASQEMDSWKNAASNLPDAIIPVVYEPSTGGFKVDLNTTPNDLSPSSYPNADVAYYSSDINKVRRIIGETVRIPIASPTYAGRGSIYVLRAGPFLDVSWDGRTRSLFVSGAPLRRSVQEVSASDSPSLFNPSRYAIDYDDAQIAFYPVPYPREFLISYSYYDANGQVQTIIDQKIEVPANAEGWMPLNVPTDNQGMRRAIVPDSETVARAFREVTPGNWSNDPYEFFVLSPKIGAFANIGVLVFNPLGRDYTEQTSAGTVPLTARIDYDVLDWHIIREDRPMPAMPPYQVRLTLKGIKTVGEFERDQTKYEGLFRGVGAPHEDFLVLNLSTGEVIPATDPNTGQKNYTVNYRDGIVTFSDAFGAMNASGNFRFYYKAHGDWGVQVQKAANQYVRSMTPGVGYAQYYLGNGTANGGDATRIYFPLTEAGKTISIRELWFNTPSGLKRANNEAYRINENPALFQMVGGQRLTWADIKSKHPEATHWPLNGPMQPTIGVQGISFRVRVIWQHSGSITQTAAGNMPRVRWRKIDLDTILTRSGE